jgi:adenylate cyclase
MTVKNILDEIENDVIDVVNTNFIYNATRVVPHSDDGELTYERAIEKKGKLIETCVLFVDIRNSVALTEKHHTQTMGRIYTAFTKAVLKIARHHNGHTRNIIGDRVMIVFPATDSYTNAVDCAISINHIAKNIINKRFAGVAFKCGIGIDFGEIRVIKVGIQRQGTERGENKGLVWVGYPANIASRLTDIANKSIEETYYEVVRNPINPRAIKPLLGLPSLLGKPSYDPSFANILSGILSPASSYDPSAPYYLTSLETAEMTPEEFANNIQSFKDGELYMMGGKFIKFSKKTRSILYPAIIMTREVYNGYKNANPKRNDVVGNYWKEQKHGIKNVTNKIYGGDINWNLENK